MITVVKAPEKYDRYSEKAKIFLAGSIEMGVAEKWQDRMQARFANFDWIILNPRRDDWDSSWEQKITDKQFYGQVDWEHTALSDANVIAMYFDPNTKSPISLLELGLFAASGKLVVCCPEGFWRKGNVDYICQKYNIPLVETFDDLCEEVICKAVHSSDWPI